jgi:hypothetical protein
MSYDRVRAAHTTGNDLNIDAGARAYSAQVRRKICQTGSLQAT